MGSRRDLHGSFPRGHESVLERPSAEFLRGQGRSRKSLWALARTCTLSVVLSAVLKPASACGCTGSNLNSRFESRLRLTGLQTWDPRHLTLVPVFEGFGHECRK